MIDWKQAQRRLGMKVDGNFGPVSYAALLMKVAGRPVPAARDLAAGMVANVPTFAVDATASRLAAFIGQCCHESAGFSKMQEDGGTAYFTRLYEDRADLGNTQPGDGARFRGRGLIQLTGRANYRRFGEALALDLVAEPGLAALPNVAVMTALEYWQDRGLSALADRHDWRGITRAINGGLNGLAERIAYIDKALEVLA